MVLTRYVWLVDFAFFLFQIFIWYCLWRFVVLSVLTFLYIGLINYCTVRTAAFRSRSIVFRRWVHKRTEYIDRSKTPSGIYQEQEEVTKLWLRSLRIRISSRMLGKQSISVSDEIISEECLHWRNILETGYPLLDVLPLYIMVDDWWITRSPHRCPDTWL